MYSLVFAVFVGGFLLIHRTVHSPFGQVLKAIRENEPRALSLGYDVNRYKLLAYVLSATLAGLAGATKVLVRPASVAERDRKSTRLNSSHITISYAVFCLKKKKKQQ